MHRPAHPGSLARWASDLARASLLAGFEPADVLAGLAAALGAPWDGPGAPVEPCVPLPADRSLGPWLLDAARQALLAAADPGRRKRLGAHHTPAAVARRLAAIALDGFGDAPLRSLVTGPGLSRLSHQRTEVGGADGFVLDPACGGGAFLLAAGEVLTAGRLDPSELVAAGVLRGMDIDAVAVATTSAALSLWAGVDSPAGAVVVADGLEAGSWPTQGAAAVVGNPPFLSPLTAGAPAGRVGAYTDAAARFLLAAVRGTRAGGRVVLVQPESILAARDAGPVRDSVLDAAALEGLWVAGEPVFAAGVRVCAPVLRVGADQSPSIRRWRGVDVHAVSAARLDVRTSRTWAPLRPVDVPPLPRAAGRLGDLATATAGFRDEYYAITAAAAESSGDADPRPRLVTSGLIDPARLRWGERRARLAGRRFDRPVVDLDVLTGRVRDWVEARLVPKALVAMQTRVVEAVADRSGNLVPVTPVVAVMPRDPADLHRVLAVLLAPAATAWAMHHYGGTALHGDGVKLSARQILELPLPTDRNAWSVAAAAVAAGDVDACAEALCGDDARLLAWWRERVQTRTRT